MGQQAGHNASGAATENLTPQEQAKAELDANILAGGGLGLDPENDPIVATTDWGLDIKVHNAGEYQGAGYLVTNPSTTGNLSSGALSGYAYITMGSYNNTALNWVIIGYSTNVATGIGVIKATNLNIPDTTDAGNALKSASSKGTLISTQYLLNAYTNAVGTTEIPGGCVLCIAEKSITTSTFTTLTDASTVTNFFQSANYAGSYCKLRTLINGFCTPTSSTLGFSVTQRSKIQPQTINSAYVSAASSYSYTYKFTVSLTSLTNQYLFPLAGCKSYNSYDGTYYDILSDTYVNGTNNYRNQNFLIETYLPTKEVKSADSVYWLRTGRAYYDSDSDGRYYGNSILCAGVTPVSSSGGMGYSGCMSSSVGVRPAFVLKL